MSYHENTPTRQCQHCGYINHVNQIYCKNWQCQAQLRFPKDKTK